MSKPFDLDKLPDTDAQDLSIGQNRPPSTLQNAEEIKKQAIQRANPYLNDFESLKEAYYAHGDISFNLRLEKLKALRETILSRKTDFIKAMQKDFYRPDEEVLTLELFPILSELNLFIKKAKSWSKPRKVSPSLVGLGASHKLIPQAKGVVLVLSPWNYPFSLAFNPLITALATGNRVMMKPSEFTPHCSQLIKEICDTVLGKEIVSVCLGGVEVSEALLRLPFDHFFFTGSPQVGKLVMKAAAEQLSSVTLELGGKSPAILDKNCDWKKVGKKIAWSKFMNAGQTCIAPDYILCPKDSLPNFKAALLQALETFYGKDQSNWIENKNLPSLASAKQFERLEDLLENTKTEAAVKEMGGKSDRDKRRISPTVFSQIDNKSCLMQEEIFGPILPIITYESEDEIFKTLHSHPNPLAMYIFSSRKDFSKKILKRTSAGGVVVNDVIVQIANHHLPFGGAGHSGIGRYHGKWGFDELSHLKPVVYRKRDYFLSFLYPPYTLKKKALIKFLYRFFPKWF